MIGFMAWGALRGFMKGILSFVTNTAAIIISILASRPIILLINNITNNTITRDGQLALHIMIAIGIFIFIKLIIMVVKCKITKIKRQNGVVNKIDRVFGLLLGFLKFIVWACITATFIMVLSGIFSGLHNFLFSSSTVAIWIYDRALDIVRPLLGTIYAALLSTFR